jgi:glycerophosphoryl diester phosphodiesterase
MGDQVVIASIYDDILADVRAQAPEVLTSMGAAEMLALDNLTDETEADYATPAPFFQPPYDLLRDETLARARRHGLVVQVWTVNEREAMVGLLERGVDGIITDDPALLREVLASP